MNAPAKLAATWFGPTERLTALTICVSAVIFGAAVGFVFPVLFIGDDDKDEVFKQNVMISLVAQAGIGLVISVVTLLMFKNKPKTPPSPSAFDRIDEDGIFLKSVKGTFANKDFMFLFLSFFFVLGSFNTLATIVSYLCQIWNYTDTEASLFGGLFIVGGIVASALIGIIVEKTHRYKLCIQFQCFFAAIFSLCQLFLFKKGITWLTGLMCFLQGSMMVSIMAVSFDFAVELTFPIGESFSSGVIMGGGQVAGIVFTLVTSKWLENVTGGQGGVGDRPVSSATEDLTNRFPNQQIWNKFSAPSD